MMCEHDDDGGPDSTLPYISTDLATMLTYALHGQFSLDKILELWNKQ